MGFMLRKLERSPPLNGNAYDPDDASLAYTWDYGDGTSGPQGQFKTYAAPGIYTATLTAFDGEASDSLKCNVLIVDDITVNTTLSLYTINLTYRFNHSHKDELLIKGQFPMDPGANVAGKVVRVLIGRYEYTGVLNAHGRTGDGVRLQLSHHNVYFKFAVNHADLYSQFSELGLNKAGSGGTTRPFYLILVFDGKPFYQALPIVYTVQQNRGGPNFATGTYSR